MLLLLWKVLRTTLGGTGDFPNLKNTARRMLEQPPIDPVSFTQKTDPLDYLLYQTETCQKYPAYIPSSTARCATCPSVPVANIANVLQAKMPTAAGAALGAQTSKGMPGNGSGGKNGKGAPNGAGAYSSTQPFIFPSSSMKSSTPKSIIEAEELFKKNMYISTATLQIYHEKNLMTDRRYQLSLEAEDQTSERAQEHKQQPASNRSRTRPRRRRMPRRVSGNGNQGDDEADEASEDEDDSDVDQPKQNGEQAAVEKEVPPVSAKERERIERIEHIYVSGFSTAKLQRIIDPKLTQ